MSFPEKNCMETGPWRIGVGSGECQKAFRREIPRLFAKPVRASLEVDQVLEQKPNKLFQFYYKYGVWEDLRSQGSLSSLREPNFRQNLVFLNVYLFFSCEKAGHLLPPCGALLPYTVMLLQCDVFAACAPRPLSPCQL